MIQDIEPYKYIPEFSEIKIKEKDFIFIFQNDEVLIKNLDGQKNILTYGEIKNKVSIEKNPIYLFSIDDKSFFLSLDAFKLPHELEIDESIYQLENIRTFREFEINWQAFAGVTAYHLYKWYVENKFCGRCGSENKFSFKERALICDCGSTRYPQISPAVIVAITDGEKILLTKYANGPYQKYALIAGFMEIGETLEDTVRRETFEEVGLKLKNIKYYNSQPWGFSGSLLAGYFAELDGDSKITLDEAELSEAKWFKREDIPLGDSDISLTQEMIELFRERKN
ncbi:MAG: NAD(+) diphosphatase [Fusobacteriaceae bacterium]